VCCTAYVSSWHLADIWGGDRVLPLKGYKADLLMPTDKVREAPSADIAGSARAPESDFRPGSPDCCIRSRSAIHVTRRPVYTSAGRKRHGQGGRAGSNEPSWPIRSAAGNSWRFSVVQRPPCLACLTSGWLKRSLSGRKSWD